MSFCLALAGFSAVAQPADPALAPPPAAARTLASWDDAVTLWAAHAPEPRLAALETSRAAGLRRQALAPLLPQLQANGTASFSLLPVPPGVDPNAAALFGAAPYQTGSIVASLALIDPRAWNGLSRALATESVAELSEADARRLGLVSLAQAVLGAVTSEKLAELSRVGLADALERAALAEKASRAGASTAIDQARTKHDVALARAQVVSQTEAVRQSREALALALGVEGSVGVAPGFVLDGLAAQVPNGCRTVADLDSRADLRVATERVSLAKASVRDAWAQYLPSLSARSTATAFVLPGQGVLPIWNLQLVLTVPLWDGGARYGASREAHAAVGQAEARRDAQVRSVRVELERAPWHRGGAGRA